MYMGQQRPKENSIYTIYINFGHTTRYSLTHPFSKGSFSIPLKLMPIEWTVVPSIVGWILGHMCVHLHIV